MLNINVSFKLDTMATIDKLGHHIYIDLYATLVTIENECVLLLLQGSRRYILYI